MLSFTSFGKGTAPFSRAALVLGWVGCITVDFTGTKGR
jgi:hypothetical protein